MAPTILEVNLQQHTSELPSISSNLTVGDICTGLNVDSHLFDAEYITNLLCDLLPNEYEDAAAFQERVCIVRDRKLPFLSYIMYRYYGDEDWHMTLSYVNNRLS